MSVQTKVFNLARPQLNHPSSLEITRGILPTLKISFVNGPVYIGEKLSSLIVINSNASEPTAIGIAVDLTLPSQQVVSLLHTEATNRILEPKAHCEELVQYEPKEAGNYSMLVSVYYKPNHDSSSESQVTHSVPVRQTCYFTAAPCVNVKTKVSTTKAQQLAVETQIENISKNLLGLETIQFLPNSGWESKILKSTTAQLLPGDIYQSCCILDRTDEKALGHGGPLGRLTLSWRREMGEKGWLTTGLVSGI
jgi:hypothetical protein